MTLSARLRMAAAAFGVTLSILTLQMPLSAQPAQAETWHMPTPYPDGALTTGVIRDFAAQVKSATKDAISITLHSNGSLVKHPEIKRAVQTSQVQLGEILVTILSNDDPIYGVDSVPFLATSYAEARKLDAASRPFIDKRLEKARMKVLFTIPWPPQALYTKKEIAALADLKGIKFRTYNPSTSRIAEMAGMIPTKIEVAELAQAFGTGMVDAMLTSSATGVDTKSWEFVSHFYDVQAWLPRSMVVINRSLFDGLPNDHKTALLAAAKMAEEAGWKASESRNEDFKKTLAAQGIKITPPSDKLKADLAAIGKTMTEEWIKAAGADGEAIITAYRQ